MSDQQNDRKNRTKEKISFRERLCKSLDLHPDVLERDTLIEIRDRYRVTVRGSCRILSYSPTDVRLKTRKGELSISGKRLFCSSYYCNFVEIEGEINDLSFKDQGGK